MTKRLIHAPTRLTTSALRQLLWCLLVCTIGCQAAIAASHEFPLYPAISKNVQFWEKIYAHYSLKQAVIHDSEDLSKIYEIVSLADPESPGGRQQNSLNQKQACEKYRAILARLAGQSPITSEERRVAALFPGMNGRQQMAVAAENVRSQSGQKERFLTGVSNSATYIAEIKKILRSYDLPEELANLPHVESSFNLKAYSRLGAAGIWQFTRETGRQYLRIDTDVDERLDPILATHAAAKYLQNSYRTVNSWPLAITSYNYGLGGILRAMEEQGSYEKIFANYNKGYFKFASRNFYSEFLAALNVLKSLEKDRNHRPAVGQSYRYLNLPGSAHINDIAKHFRLPVSVIEEFNPALRPPVIAGDKLIPKKYVLRLPATGGVNQLVASLPSPMSRNDQKTGKYHRVKKGDTAHSIARQHGVSLKSLLQANNLDQNGKIHPNQNLTIPGKARAVAESESPVKSSPSRADVPGNVTTSNSLPNREV
jgi:membrane-bound lytic murein transglycosylase D